MNTPHAKNGVGLIAQLSILQLSCLRSYSVSGLCPVENQSINRFRHQQVLTHSYIYGCNYHAEMRKEEIMISARRTSIIVGVLFIIGTVAGSLSIFYTGPILDDPDYLSKVAAGESQILTGALLVLVMGLALALVPVVMFPIARRHNEVLATGYLVFRGALETALYIVFVCGLLLLIPLSKEYLQAGAPSVSCYPILGALLRSGDFQFAPMLKIVFSMGALMFYCLLYQSKLFRDGSQDGALSEPHFIWSQDFCLCLVRSLSTHGLESSGIFPLLSRK